VGNSPGGNPDTTPAADAYWAHGGHTNIDNLTFACKPHHRLITTHGWTTRKNTLGHTEWTLPPDSPRPPGTNQGGVNDYHHPERLLDGDHDPPPPDE
jgi:hypothetical protein